jgi:hypothetical protein
MEAVGHIRESTFQVNASMIYHLEDQPLYANSHSRIHAMPPKKLIYQFKITLKETHPPVWRRIQVPSTYPSVTI